jgi:hypothetical protein
MRDTMAEMAAKAHEISLEAGSKMAAAMKDVIGAAAGLTTFAIESARDLVQYMVRRGQMTQDEADKLIREAEEAHARNPRQPKSDSVRKPPVVAPVTAKPVVPVVKHATPPRTVKASPPAGAKQPSGKTAGKHTAKKPAKAESRSAAKHGAKKASAKKK